jgi:signal transduction histidine kinase
MPRNQESPHREQETRARDANEARQAARRLEESLVQVRRLAAHLQEMREEERRRIAREIHDELGQQLAGLKIDVVALERELQRSSSALAPRAASMKTLIDQVMGSVRRLSAELQPGLLDDFGLVAAIEWQAEVFEEHTGIATELVIETNDAGLSTPRLTAIFRVLQESLTNVARHARADRVRIALRREADRLCLEVTDNGVGLEARRLRDPGSYGIAGMRERLLALGGAFSIEGGKGHGTSVRANLPLDRAFDLASTAAR